MRFIPGEENWNGPSEKEMAFVAPTEEKIPETKEIREPFREMTIIDTSQEDEKEMNRQIKDIKDGSGLDVTSYAKRPNGTIDLMLEKIRKINHLDSSKCGYNTNYNLELYKNRQAS